MPCWQPVIQRAGPEAKTELSAGYFSVLEYERLTVKPTKRRTTPSSERLRTASCTRVALAARSGCHSASIAQTYASSQIPLIDKSLFSP